MSKENVVLFINAAEKEPELKERLGQSDKTSAWVDIAGEAGFEFTADEFRSLVEETVQKTITVEAAVREYLAARETLEPGEFSQRALESVVGGTGTAEYVSPPPIIFPPQFIQVKRPTL